MRSAGRARLTWAELPGWVRERIEHSLDAPVVSARSHESGYSPGMAATLTTADGTRVFVKAVSSGFHERSAELYRDEARVNRLLPAGAPAPRMRWSWEEGEWVALAFEVGEGSVSVPWRPADLDDALATLSALATFSAPAELDRVSTHLAAMRTWRHALEGAADLSSWDPWVAAHLPDLAELAADWAQAADGDSLGHGDARADNMIRSSSGVLLVDWPYAAAAAPWLELLCFLPSAALEGAGDPERIWAAQPLGRAAEAEHHDRVTAVLAGLTGYFVHASVQPPPVGVPHVRGYQRAQGEVALAWLRRRIGA